MGRFSLLPGYTRPMPVARPKLGSPEAMSMGKGNGNGNGNGKGKLEGLVKYARSHFMVPIPRGGV